MEWISPSLLSFEDFESIKNEVDKFNYSVTKSQKLSSFYLCEKFEGPTRAQWSVAASTIIVYCATSSLESDDIMQIPDGVCNFIVTDWLARLRMFYITTKKKNVARDCVHQLFKAGKISIESLIDEPTLLGALAHRISVHELMEPKIKGQSIVYRVLEKRDRVKIFIQSLYNAYKDDIQYIIAIPEFLLMVRCNLQEILQFLNSTNVKFPEIDRLISYLHPSVVEAVNWHKVEPVKQTGFNDFKKAIYEGSTVTKKMSADTRKLTQIIESMIPYVNFFENQLRTASQPLGTGFVGDSTFPFLELPMEIIEIILQCADYRSAQSLMCVSLGLKQRMKSIDAKILLKSHFLRKYHVLDRHEQLASLGAIYWRDTSILARWNRGKYNKFQIEASLEAMDENIMVMSVGKPTGSFFWTRCDDSTRTKHEINISVRAHNYHQACIIDSTPEHSIIGIIDRDELEVYVGSNVVSTHTLSETKDPYSYNIPCFKNKLYIDKYIYYIDNERFSSTRIKDNIGNIIDVNPCNEMYASIKSIQFYQYQACVWSAKHEKVGVIDKTLDTSVIKFLDEHRIVCGHTNKIDVLDIRKLNGTTISSIEFSEPFNLPRMLLDVVNQRVIRLAKVRNLESIASIWDLNTCSWAGEFYVEKARGINSNTRFFCEGRLDQTNMLDFAV
jgi:hypothetical protein